MVAIKIKNSSLLKSSEDSDMEAEKKIIQSNMMIKKEIEKLRKDAEEGDGQMDMGTDNRDGDGEKDRKEGKRDGKEKERDKMGREMSNMGEDLALASHKRKVRELAWENKNNKELFGEVTNLKKAYDAHLWRTLNAWDEAV